MKIRMQKSFPSYPVISIFLFILSILFNSSISIPMARWNNVCEDNSPIYDRNDHYLPAFPYSSHLESECRVKDFKVGKLLGRGGFGRVFKGIHVPSGKLVALKIAKKRHGSIQYK